MARQRVMDNSSNKAAPLAWTSGRRFEMSPTPFETNLVGIRGAGDAHDFCFAQQRRSSLRRGFSDRS